MNNVGGSSLQAGHVSQQGQVGNVSKGVETNKTSSSSPTASQQAKVMGGPPVPRNTGGRNIFVNLSRVQQGQIKMQAQSLSKAFSPDSPTISKEEASAKNVREGFLMKTPEGRQQLLQNDKDYDNALLNSSPKLKESTLNSLEEKLKSMKEYEAQNKTRIKNRDEKVKNLPKNERAKEEELNKADDASLFDHINRNLKFLNEKIAALKNKQ